MAGHLWFKKNPMASIGWPFSFYLYSFHFGDVPFNSLGSYTYLFRHLRYGHFWIPTNYLPDFYPGFYPSFPLVFCVFSSLFR